MSTIFSFLELKFRPAANNNLSVLNKLCQNVFQTEQFWYTTIIYKCQNIVMEGRLKTSKLVELVQDLLWEGILL